MSLLIRNLTAKVRDGATILNNLNLEIPKGEVHALMGPNGSGKSTLSKVLCGHPDYEVLGGEVSLDGQDLFAMDIDARSRAGLFLAFQYPVEIPGVSMANFMKEAMQSRLPEEEKMDPVAFYKQMRAKMAQLGIDPSFTKRAVNEGFSGGEKKRNDILQMLMLEPSYAILDETDSGLDVDALRIVAEGVNAMRAPYRSFLVITHYERLLDYIRPSVVHVMSEGRIVKSGGYDLVAYIDKNGFDFIR